MLKQHSQLFVLLLILADACAIASAWVLSFYVRFEWLPVDPLKGVPEFGDHYLAMLPVIVVAQLLIFYRLRLYRPRREATIISETRDIVKAFFVAVVAVVLIDYSMPQSSKISRKFILTYAAVGTTCFAIFRGAVRVYLRNLRRRGMNRRTAAIVGSGRAAQRLQRALANNAWTGIETQYFVDDRVAGTRRTIRNLPIHGPLDDLRRIIEREPVDQIFVALPTAEADRIDEVLAALETSMADVRLVPEIDPHYAMWPNISDLDGVPIISLRQTPLYGSNAIVKRSFDLFVGTICLLIAAVPMLAITVAVKLTSPGPVLFRQRRMGLDGYEFYMMKFRTMRTDAEKDGPVWSRKEDSRRTPIGGFLRRTSLDELPNLFNVLRGEMSLVGPRPERPEFIDQFKHEIPKYMLRHKMKAGMTGYAQVKGWRGETSLKKRIQHDVHYIRHWSLGLDIRILLQTVFGVWFSKHEA
ncbi:MAG: undecaprenyl-phosphate glucose phosphotransferase [Phycisphaerae bacterium]